MESGIPVLSIYTRTHRIAGAKNTALAENVASELAEIIFIAVFLDRPVVASMAMDKYLDVIKLREPVFTEAAIAPLTLIKPDEWKNHFTSEQRLRLLNLGNQSIQQLMDRQRSLTQWQYKQISNQANWPWRRAYFQRNLLRSYEMDFHALDTGQFDEKVPSRVFTETTSLEGYNQLLSAIQNYIRSIQTESTN